MNLKYLEQHVRHYLIGVETFINRLRGRSFIRIDQGAMAIEVTGACNLKCKFCAYEKKLLPKVNMSNEMFIDCVNQATDLGYDWFELTPCTGDVFMDKHFFEKLEYLERNPKVKKYNFYTNLTIPKRNQIMQLMSLKKLSALMISIYGHNEKSFIDITKSTPKVYERLIDNLKTILEQDSLPFSLALNFRSTSDVPSADSSDLMKIISKYRNKGFEVNSSHGVFNNWGGEISQEDVIGLNVKIMPSEKKLTPGACAKLFDAPQITAAGIVNACSCRDANATLRIGDIRETTLDKIISVDNIELMRLIDEQEAGKFRPVCDSCDYYRSVYHHPKNYRRGNVPTQTISEFITQLRVRRNNQTNHGQ